MQRESKIEEAFARKYPEQVVLVTTHSPEGAPNVMAVGWVMIASGEPAMFALGIDDEAYTYELITKTKEFVVAYPNAQMAKETLFAGSCHGQGRDKLKDAGLAVQDGVKVKAPLVADAVANFECELVDIARPGDCPVIFGKVVAAHVNKDRSLGRLFTVGKAHRLAGVGEAKQAK